MSTIVSYKGNTLTIVDKASKSKILKTSGKYMEDDIYITDTETYTATLVNAGISTYNYVKFNGTSYYTAYQTFTFQAGESLSIYAYGQDSDESNRGGQIIIDGTTVVETTNKTRANYTYVLPNSDIRIRFTNGGQIGRVYILEAPSMHTATVTGNGNENYCYINYAGDKYFTDGDCFSFYEGDPVTVFCSGANNGTITLNGETVQTQGSYFYYTPPANDLTINMYYGSSSKIEITEIDFGDGIKYVYTDIDGEGAWNVHGYDYVSYDYAAVRDNKSRYWVEIDSNDLSLTAPVSVPTYADYRYTGMINWGDGTTSEFSYNNLNNTHTYSKPGRYVVTMQWTGGSERFSLGSFNTADRDKILGIEIWMWGYPANTIHISNFNNLQKVTITSAQTTVGFIDDCPKLEQIIMPNTVTTLQTLYRNISLKKITIPASVTSIESNCFSGNTSMEEYHIKPTTPPTLGTNAFENIPSDCKIYVPSASLSAYQSATNWSTYALQMVGE